MALTNQWEINSAGTIIKRPNKEKVLLFQKTLKLVLLNIGINTMHMNAKVPYMIMIQCILYNKILYQTDRYS